MTNSSRRETRLGWLYIAPWVIGLALFTVYPVIASLVLSMSQTGEGGRMSFVGLQNYRAAFRDPVFWTALYNTLFLSVIGIPLSQALSLGTAMLVKRDLRGVGAYRAIFFLPSVMPAVASGILWKWLFNPRLGPVNHFLGFLGLQGPVWLGDPLWIKPSLIIMGFWGVGSTMVIYLAGLQDIPKELYEAARIDGAGPLAQFRKVTFPMLKPVTLFNTVMAVIGSFQAYQSTIIMLDMNGGANKSALVYGLYVYTNAFRDFKMGYASALAWILLAITAVTTAFTYRFLKPDEGRS
jgi:multiple sugar transport system permease protein